jgi:putative acetyltransferase
VIRDARPDDREGIAALTDAAFGGEEEAMRIVREAEPAIELVWEEDDRLLGHVLLSRVRLGTERPLQLAPLSVDPARQGRGIGGALTREALARADAQGEPFVLVLGHPGYYPRFGFEPAAPLGILGPHDFGAAWMLARLSRWDPSLRGTVEFPPSFG